MPRHGKIIRTEMSKRTQSARQSAAASLWQAATCLRSQFFLHSLSSNEPAVLDAASADVSSGTRTNNNRTVFLVLFGEGSPGKALCLLGLGGRTMWRDPTTVLKIWRPMVILGDVFRCRVEGHVKRPIHSPTRTTSYPTAHHNNSSSSHHQYRDDKEKTTLTIPRYILPSLSIEFDLNKSTHECECSTYTSCIRLELTGSLLSIDRTQKDTPSCPAVDRSPATETARTTLLRALEIVEMFVSMFSKMSP